MGVEAGGGDGQVAAQAVDVLHQGHVHLQAPLARRLLRVSGVDAGTPGRDRAELLTHRVLDNYTWGTITHGALLFTPLSLSRAVP